jgi:hypothetical protein
MIDPHSIEDCDEWDDERAHCYGRDPDTEEWRWEWVSFERLYEHDRFDLLPR